MSKTKPVKEISLAPEGVFKNVVKTPLSSTKPKSEEQLPEFLASNMKNREAKNRR